MSARAKPILLADPHGHVVYHERRLDAAEVLQGHYPEVNQAMAMNLIAVMVSTGRPFDGWTVQVAPQ